MQTSSKKHKQEENSIKLPENKQKNSFEFRSNF